MEEEGCMMKYNDQYQPSREFINHTLGNFSKEIDNLLMQQLEKAKNKDLDNVTIDTYYVTMDLLDTEESVNTLEYPSEDTSQLYSQIEDEIAKTGKSMYQEQLEQYQSQPQQFSGTQQMSSQPPTNGKKFFSCSLCHMSFKRKKKLSAHCAEKHTTTNGNFYCSLCAKTFKRKKSLNIHNKYQHSANIQLHSCSKCQKKFKKRFDLKKHEEICNNNGQCPHCGETYKSIRTLANHVTKKHSNENLPKVWTTTTDNLSVDWFQYEWENQRKTARCDAKLNKLIN